MIWAVVAIVIPIFTGCQHPSPPAAHHPSEAWRVLERVGDVRVAEKSGSLGTPLRPGEIIVGDRQLSTGKGALLILAGDGIQLTTGEESSFRLVTGRLAASGTDSALILDEGWLRVRLTRAVDRKMSIKTADFGINAASSTLLLHAGLEGSGLTVEAGNATLATTDGRHHATLIAGAAAKIDKRSGHGLLVRPALGQAFSKVTPLAADPRFESDVRDRSAPKADDVQKPKVANVQEMTIEPRPIHPASARGKAAPKTMTILPASRPKRTGLSPSDSPEPIESAAVSSKPEVPPLPSTIPLTATSDLLSERKSTFPTSPKSVDDGRTADPAPRRAEPNDPLQLKFDQLTHGLIDGL